MSASDPGLLAAVDAWRGAHPLARLRDALLAHARGGKDKRRRDVLAEAMVARHLVDRDCEVRFEVATPNGRTCDFEVRAPGGVFHLHVKRLQGHRRDRTLTISGRLRSLEQIRRPYVVGVRWRGDATDEQMQQLVAEATPFLGRASIGDELVVRDPEGHDLGGVRVLAGSEWPRVSLVIGLPGGFSDEAPRVRRLLERAHQQFMPRSVNVILLAMVSGEDREIAREALLGSHEERWDAFPRLGERTAYGRADDGFWAGNHFSESTVAGWFPFDPTRPLECHLLFRESPAVDSEHRWLIERCLGSAPIG